MKAVALKICGEMNLKLGKFKIPDKKEDEASAEIASDISLTL